MLNHLLIENYALIEKLDARFGEGLIVITGETGAGKSILLGALSLILGQRADTKVLRDKNRKCIIEGSFSLQNTPGLKTLFEAYDLDYEDYSVFRREITPQGKSRAFINDTPVTLQVMKLVTGKLIDIHSQHESLLLGTSDFQFAVVDNFAGNMQKVDAYQSLFQQYRQQTQKLRQMEEDEKAARSDLSYFKFQYDELEAARLDASEFENMEEELKVQRNAEEIAHKLEKAMFLLQNSEMNVIDNATEVHATLRTLSSFGRQYQEITNRLDSLLIETKDLCAELEHMKSKVVHDPEYAALLESRFDLIQKLMHKHNAAGIEQLVEIKNAFLNKINAAVSLEEKIAQENEILKEQQQALETMASELSELRAAAIPKIQDEVMEKLKSLAMPHARFIIKQEQSDTPGHKGKDRLTFLFSANPGSDLQEVSGIASGGELSRFMLSIKSMLSAKNLLPTIIFDEIDTGISGETSSKVAEILQAMSRSMQVIAITHMPQIASRGITHFLVYKKIENGKTSTGIKMLDSEERIGEIAKMLGGEKPSKMMFESAKELIFRNQN